MSELQEIFMVTCAEKTVNGGSKLIYKKYCTVKLCAENPMLSIIIVSVSVKIQINIQNEMSKPEFTISFKNQCTKITNNAQ